MKKKKMILNPCLNWKQLITETQNFASYPFPTFSEQPKIDYRAKKGEKRELGFSDLDEENRRRGDTVDLLGRGNGEDVGVADLLTEAVRPFALIADLTADSDALLTNLLHEDAITGQKKIWKKFQSSNHQLSLPAKRVRV